MRLIDADALIDRMYHDAFETDTDMQKWDGGCWIRYKMFENAIDDAPTVNADRPQGYWTKTEVATYRCSECGKIQIADDVNELNYCCCCGSNNKMRRLKGADDE